VTPSKACDVVRETLVTTVDKVVEINTDYIQVVSIEMEELRYFSTRGGDERLTFEEVSQASFGSPRSSTLLLDRNAGQLSSSDVSL
jgi:hypothetical protein